MKLDSAKDEIIYRLYRRQEARFIANDLIERNIFKEDDMEDLLKAIKTMKESVERFRINMKKTK